MSVTIGYGVEPCDDPFIPGGGVARPCSYPPALEDAPRPGEFWAGLVERNLSRTQTILPT